MTQTTRPRDGEPVAAVDMASALTAETLLFDDGTAQVFTADGRTTFVEPNRTTTGEWSVVGDGEFFSLWPPDYRATYTLRWIVRGTSPIGLSFSSDANGQRFDGVYRGSGDEDSTQAGAE